MEQRIGQDKVDDFLEKLSSKAPVPGGGGASAVGAAIGNGLGQMVANLTIGKKKYKDAEPEIQELLGKMEVLKKEFMRLADADVEVFAPLAASYSLPSGTEEEKAKKDEIMEKNLLAATLIPIEIMEKSIHMLDILEVLGKKGSRMAISDVGVGVQFVRAALLGAVMNVYINTKSMKVRKKAEELNAYADSMVARGTKKADRIYQEVLRALR